MEIVNNKEGESDLFRFMDEESKQDSTTNIRKVFVQTLE
jgi:hypothetical protein